MNKSNKTQKQTKSDFVSLRIKQSTKKEVETKMKFANKKTLGRKITMDQLVQMAIAKIDNGDIKKLQNQSLSNEDRKEQLRHLYIKENGNVSPDEFMGLLLSGACSEFVQRHNTELGVAQGGQNV